MCHVQLKVRMPHSGVFSGKKRGKSSDSTHQAAGAWSGCCQQEQMGLCLTVAQTKHLCPWFRPRLGWGSGLGSPKSERNGEQTFSLGFTSPSPSPRVRSGCRDRFVWQKGSFKSQSTEKQVGGSSSCVDVRSICCSWAERVRCGRSQD